MTLQQWPQGGGLRGGEAGGWGPEMAGDWVTLGQGANTMGLRDKEARATHRAGTRTTQTSAERTDHCGGGGWRGLISSRTAGVGAPVVHFTAGDPRDRALSLSRELPVRVLKAESGRPRRQGFSRITRKHVSPGRTSDARGLGRGAQDREMRGQSGVTGAWRSSLGS